MQTNKPSEDRSQSLRKIGVWIVFILGGAFFVYVSYLAIWLTLGWVSFWGRLNVPR